MYTYSTVGKGERYAGCLMFSDHRLTGFPLDGSYFLNIVGLLVEKSREAVERRYREVERELS